MRVKLDENLPVQLKALFAESGHDAATVVDEGLGGASDSEVAVACLAEERGLVTQDLDSVTYGHIRLRSTSGLSYSGYPLQPGTQSWTWGPC